MKKGLFGKYIISKSDGTDIDENADYFVLRLDSDEAAREAALKYANLTDNAELKKDLEWRISHYRGCLQDSK